jgi:hypothetical protein
MGTTRIKASATAHSGETHSLLDDPGAPKSFAFISSDVGNHQIFFAERACEGFKIQPIKDIVCGFAEIPFSISATTILKQLFRDIVVSLRQKFSNQEDVSNILFAVAVPAGLSIELQNQILRAALNCGVELDVRIDPFILNEAEWRI